MLKPAVISPEHPPQETEGLLSAQGFGSTHLWYHGTSSALLESIQKEGLKGAGDQAFNAALQKTLKTLGHQNEGEIKTPVFLTPSKDLAHYWALERVKARRLRFGASETPLVLALQLPPALNQQVRPDVGAASFLLLPEGEAYLAYLAALYERHGFTLPPVDVMQLAREAYLNDLGLAYIESDLPPACISNEIFFA